MEQVLGFTAGAVKHGLTVLLTNERLVEHSIMVVYGINKLMERDAGPCSEIVVKLLDRVLTTCLEASPPAQVTLLQSLQQLMDWNAVSKQESADLEAGLRQLLASTLSEHPIAEGSAFIPTVSAENTVGNTAHQSESQVHQASVQTADLVASSELMTTLQGLLGLESSEQAGAAMKQTPTLAHGSSPGGQQQQQQQQPCSRGQVLAQAAGETRLLPRLLQLLTKAAAALQAGGDQTSAPAGGMENTKQGMSKALSTLAQVMGTCSILACSAASWAQPGQFKEVMELVPDAVHHVAAVTHMLLLPCLGQEQCWDAALGFEGPTRPHAAASAHKDVSTAATTIQPPQAPSPLLAFWVLLQQLPLSSDERQAARSQLLTALYSSPTEEASKPDMEAYSRFTMAVLPLPSSPHLAHFTPLHAVHMVAIAVDGGAANIHLSQNTLKLLERLVAGGMSSHTGADANKANFSNVSADSPAAVQHLLELTQTVLRQDGSFTHSTAQRSIETAPAASPPAGDSSASLPLMFRDLFDMDITETTEVVVSRTSARGRSSDSLDLEPEYSQTALQAAARCLLQMWCRCLQQAGDSSNKAGALQLQVSHMPHLQMLACEAAASYPSLQSTVQAAVKMFLSTLLGALPKLSIQLQLSLLHSCMFTGHAGAPAASVSASVRHILAVHAAAAAAMNAPTRTPDVDMVVDMWRQLLGSCQLNKQEGQSQHAQLAASWQAKTLAPLLLVTASASSKCRAAVLAACLQQLHAIQQDLQQEVALGAQGSEKQSSSTAQAETSDFDRLTDCLAKSTLVAGAACVLTVLEQGCPGWVLQVVQENVKQGVGWQHGVLMHSAADRAAVSAVGHAAAVGQVMWAVLKPAVGVQSAAAQQLWQLCTSPESWHASQGTNVATADAKEVMSSLQQVCSKVLPACWLRLVTRHGGCPTQQAANTQQLLQCSILSGSTLLQYAAASDTQVGRGITGFNICDTLPWVAQLAAAFDQHACMTSMPTFHENLVNLGCTSLSEQLTDTQAAPATTRLFSAPAPAEGQHLAGWLQQLSQQVQLQQYNTCEDFMQRPLPLLMAASEMLLHMLQSNQVTNTADQSVQDALSHLSHFCFTTYHNLVELLLADITCALPVGASQYSTKTTTDAKSTGAFAAAVGVGVIPWSSTQQPATSSSGSSGTAALSSSWTQALHQVLQLPLSVEQLTDCLVPAAQAAATRQQLQALFGRDQRHAVHKEVLAQLQAWLQSTHNDINNTAASASTALLLVHHTPLVVAHGSERAWLSTCLHACQRVLRVLTQLQSEAPHQSSVHMPQLAKQQADMEFHAQYGGALYSVLASGHAPSNDYSTVLARCQACLEWCVGTLPEGAPCAASSTDQQVAGNTTPQAACSTDQQAASGVVVRAMLVTLQAVQEVQEAGVPPSTPTQPDSTNSTPYETSSTDVQLDAMATLLLQLVSHGCGATGLAMWVQQNASSLDVDTTDTTLQTGAVSNSRQLLASITRALRDPQCVSDAHLQQLLLHTGLSAADEAQPTDTPTIQMWATLLAADFNSVRTKPDGAGQPQLQPLTYLVVRLISALAQLHVANMLQGREDTAHQLLLVALTSCSEHGSQGSYALVQCVHALDILTQPQATTTSAASTTVGPVHPQGAMHVTANHLAGPRQEPTQLLGLFLPLVELLAASMQEAQQLLQQGDQAPSASTQARDSGQSKQSAGSASTSSTNPVTGAHPMGAANLQGSSGSAAHEGDTHTGSGPIAAAAAGVVDLAHEDEDRDEDEDDEDDGDEFYEQGEQGGEQVGEGDGEGEDNGEEDEGEFEEYEEGEEYEDYEEGEDEGEEGEGEEEEDGEGDEQAGEQPAGQPAAAAGLNLPQELLETLLDSVAGAVGAAAGAGGAGRQGSAQQALGSLLSWDLLLEDEQHGLQENLQALEQAVMQELQRVAQGGVVLPARLAGAAAAAGAQAQQQQRPARRSGRFSALAAGLPRTIPLDDVSSDDDDEGTLTGQPGAVSGATAGGTAGANTTAAAAPATSRQQVVFGLADALSSDSSSDIGDGSDADDSSAGCTYVHSEDQSAGAGAQAGRKGGKSSTTPMVQCSYGKSGEDFVEQHWYYCYTCGLVDSKGCCGACAQTCHRGHDLVHAAYSRFFCDCGAGAGAPSAVRCTCLQPTPVPQPMKAAPAVRDMSHWTVTSMASRPDACWPMGDPLQRAWCLPGARPNTMISSARRPMTTTRLVQLLRSCSGAQPARKSHSGRHGSHEESAQQLVGAVALGLHALLQPCKGNSAHLSEPATLPPAVTKALATACAVLIRLGSAVASATKGSLHTAKPLGGVDGQAEDAKSPSSTCNLLLPGATGQGGDKVATAGKSEDSSSKAQDASNTSNSPATSPSCSTATKTERKELLRLQRIVRIGNLDGRSSSSRSTGGRSAGRGGRAADVEMGQGVYNYLPAQHAEAVENGGVQHNTVSLCQATGLLAVARGTYLGFLDAEQHLLEMIGTSLASSAAAKLGAVSIGSTTEPSSSTSTAAAGAASSTAASSKQVQKPSYSLLQRHNARFTILSVAFDACLGRHLAVVGLDQVQVWVVDSEGHVQDRLPISLPSSGPAAGAAPPEGGALDGAGIATGGASGGGAGLAAAPGMASMITRVQWLPGSDTWLAVTTPVAVHVYNIAVSKQKPVWTCVVKAAGGTRPSTPVPVTSTAESQAETTAPAQLGTMGELLASSVVVALPPAKPTLVGLAAGDASQTAALDQYHILMLTRDGVLYRAALPALDAAPWAPLTAAVQELPVTMVSGLQEHLSSTSGTGSTSSGVCAGLGLQACPAAGQVLVSLASVGAPDNQHTMLLKATYQPATCTVSDVQTLQVVQLAPDPDPAAADAASTAVGTTPSTQASGLSSQAAGTSARQADSGYAVHPTWAIHSRSPTCSVLEVNMLPAARAAFDCASLLLLPLQARKPAASTSSNADASSSAACSPSVLVACMPSSADPDSNPHVTCQSVSLQHASSGPDACLEGISCMPCPTTHQTLVIIATSKGDLYFCITPPRLDGVPPLEPLASHVCFEQVAQQALSSSSTLSTSATPSRPPVTHATVDPATTAAQVPGPNLDELAEAWGSSAPAPVWSRLLARRHASCFGPPAWVQAQCVAGAAAASGASNKPGSSAAGVAVAGEDATSSYDALPITLLEGAKDVCAQLQFGGDVDHVGGSEAVRRMVCNPANMDTYLEAPSRSSLRLTLKGVDPSVIIVGAKVLLGVSGDRYLPTHVRLGPTATTRVLPAHGNSPTRRWYGVMLSAEDAITAAHQQDLVLQLGPTNDGTSRPRLHHLQVFALPGDIVKARVPPPSKEPPKLPTSTAGLIVASMCNPYSAGLQAQAPPKATTSDATDSLITMLHAVDSTVRALQIEGDREAVSGEQLQGAQQLALAVLAPQPAHNGLGGVHTDAGDQAAAWDLFQLCRSAEQPGVPVQQQVETAEPASGDTSTNTTPVDTTAEGKADSSESIWVVHAALLSQAAAELRSWSPGAYQSDVQVQFWSDSQCYAALDAIAAVLYVSLNGPQHLVRWMLDTAHAWKEAHATATTKTTTSKVDSAHPLDLILGVLHASQQACYWLKARSGSPLLPVSLTWSLAAAVTHSLLALHVAAAVEPCILQLPTLPPSTGSHSSPQSSRMAVSAGFGGALGHDSNPEIQTGPAAVNLDSMPTGSSTPFLHDNSPPMLRLPPFHNIGHGGSAASPTSMAARSAPIAFGAIAAAARSTSAHSQGMSTTTPLPTELSATGMVDGTSGTTPLPTGQQQLGVGQLLVQLIQTGGGFQGWLAQHLPSLLPQVLHSSWFASMAASAQVGHEGKPVSLEGEAQSLVMQLGAAVSVQLSAMAQAAGSSGCDAAAAMDASTSPRLPLLPACQLLASICAPTCQKGAAGLPSEQQPAGSSASAAAQVPKLCISPATALQYVLPVCTAKLQQVLRALQAGVLQASCNSQPYAGELYDLHALQALLPKPAGYTQAVGSHGAVQAVALSEQLLQQLISVLVMLPYMLGKQELDTGSGAAAATQQLIGLVQQLEAVLQYVLPVLLQQHDYALLQATFRAGPANRKQVVASTSRSTGTTASTNTPTSTNSGASGVLGVGGYVGFQGIVQPQTLFLERAHGVPVVPSSTARPALLSRALLLQLHQGQAVLRQALGGVIHPSWAMLLARAALSCLDAAYSIMAPAHPTLKSSTSGVSAGAAERSISLMSASSAGHDIAARSYSPSASMPRSHALSSPTAGAPASPSQLLDLEHQQLMYLVCRAMETRALHGARQQAKHVLAHWCGSEEQQHHARHVALMQHQGQLLTKAARGLLQLPDSWAVRCVRDASLARLHALAQASPAAWQQLSSQQPMMIATLVQLAIQLACDCRPSAQQAVQLLNSSVGSTGAGTTSKPGLVLPRSTAETATGALLSVLGLAPQAQLSTPSDNAADAQLVIAQAAASPLTGFVHACVLHCSDSHVRRAASAFLLSVYKRCDVHAQQQLLWVVLAQLPAVPQAGEAGRHLCKLADNMLSHTNHTASSIGHRHSVTRKASQDIATPGTTTADAQGAASPGSTGPAGHAGNSSRPAGVTSPHRPSHSKPVHHSPAAGNRAGQAAQACTSVHLQHVCHTLMGLLSHVHEVQAVHPLRKVYSQLGQVLDMKGSYLEPHPMTALKPRPVEQEYKLSKLESLKQSIRYTSSQVMASLLLPQSIKALTLTFTDTRRSRCIAAIKVSYYDDMAPDVAHLKTPAGQQLWKPLAMIHLAPCQPDCALTLATPVTVTAICFEVVGVHSSLQDASQENLTCPRCSSPVTDRFGVCGYCGENAHQCRHCRNINYGQLEGFLCAECGHSRYCRIDLHLLAAPAWQLPPLSTDDEVKSVQQQVVTIQEELASRHAALAVTTRTLSTALADLEQHTSGTSGSLHAGGVSGSSSRDTSDPGGATADVEGMRELQKAQTVSAKLAAISNIYNSKCKVTHQDILLLYRKLAGLRAALLCAGRPAGSVPPTPPATLLYSSMQGQTFAAVQGLHATLLSLLLTLTRHHPGSHHLLLSAGLLPQLFNHDLQDSSPSVRSAAARLLLELTHLTPHSSLTPVVSVLPDPRVAPAGLGTPRGLASGLGSPRAVQPRSETSGSPTTTAARASSLTSLAMDVRHNQMSFDELSAAQGQLVSLLRSSLLPMVKSFNQHVDWQHVRSMVDMLVQGVRIEVASVPQSATAVAVSMLNNPEARASLTRSGSGVDAGSGPRIPTSGLLDLALQLLVACTHSSREQGMGAGMADPLESTWVVNGVPELGPQRKGPMGTCSQQLSEQVVQPLLQLLASLLRDRKRQLMSLVASHLLQSQLTAWSSTAAAQPTASPAPAPVVTAVTVETPARGPLNSVGESETQKVVSPQQLGRKKGSTPALPGLEGPMLTSGKAPFSPANAPGSYAAQNRQASTTQPSGYAAKYPPQKQFPQKQALVTDSPSKSQGSPPTPAPTPAPVTQETTLPKPTFESCAAQVPDMLLHLLGSFLLDPHHAPTRATAMQLFSALHVEKVVLQKQPGNGGRSSSRAAVSPSLLSSGQSPSRASTTANTGTSRNQSHKEGVSEPASSPLLPAPADKQRASLLLLETLLLWLPAACAAGTAGDEVLRVALQDCVTAAASQGAYQLLARLMSCAMSLLPQLVWTCACQETPSPPVLPSLMVPEPAVQPPTGTTEEVVPAPTASPTPMRMGQQQRSTGASYCVQQLTALLVKLLEYSELQGHLLTAPPLQLPNMPQTASLLALLVWSYAGLQALRLQVSSGTRKAEAQLRDALTARFLKGGDEMRRTLIRACMSALSLLLSSSGSASKGSAAGGDVTAEGTEVMPSSMAQRMQQAVLQQALTAIAPPKDEDASQDGVSLLLDKAATQEEFIPGTMGNTPYKAADIGGPLMRDVKNFICRRLDLGALIDDDFGMELLVAGSIVHLSLPIQGVYEQVWRPFLASGSGRLARYAAAVSASAGPNNPPMVVTYRLSGLDGEATEPVVKSLAGGADQQQQQANPEREFAAAAVLSDSAEGGLPLLLSMLRCDITPTCSSPMPSPGTQLTTTGSGGAATAVRGASLASTVLSTSTSAVRQVSLQQGMLPHLLQPVRLLLLRLLHTVSQLRKCRVHLLELGAVPVLVARVHACMNSVLQQTAGQQSTAFQADSVQTAPSQQQAAPALSLLGWNAADPAAAARALTGASESSLLLEPAVSVPVLLEPATLVSERLSVEQQLTELQVLLGLLEVLAGELAAQPSTGAAWQSARSKETEPDSAYQVRQLADGLHALSMIPGAQECAAVLARLLPLLAHGNYQAQVGLLDHFQPSLDMDALDAASPAKQEVLQSQLTSFIELLQSLPLLPAASSTATTSNTNNGGGTGGIGSTAAGPSSSAATATSTSSAGAASFRELLLQRQVPAALTSYLLSSFQQQSMVQLTPVHASASTGSFSHIRRATAFDTATSTPLPFPAPARAATGSSPGFPPPTPPSPGAVPSLPNTPSGLRLHSPSGLSRSMIMGGTSHTPVDGAGSWCIPPGTAAWKAALAQPGVVSALKLLASLSQGHAGIASQICEVTLPPGTPSATTPPADFSSVGGGPAATPLLPLLHMLEGVSGGPVAAPLAEALLDTLSSAAGPGSAIAVAVSELRDASQRRQKELAARRRQAMLSSMKVSPMQLSGTAGTTPPSTVPPSPSPALEAGWQTPTQLVSPPGGRSTAGGTAEPVASRTGFRPSDGGSTVRPSPRDALVSPAGSQLALELAALEAEDEDVDGETEQLRCRVCREGYRVRPHDLLCVYVYCKPMYTGAIGASVTSGGALPTGGTTAMLLPEGSPCSAVYSSVTHFNLIHASCHASARSADASLRQPKREWDGASLRNGEVRCNNLLPLPSPDVSETATETAISTWWDNLQQLSPCLQSGSLSSPPPATSTSAGGAGSRQPLMTRQLWTQLKEEGPVLHTVTSLSDLASLVIRFAARQSFSVDCGGGGRDSNAALVPCLVKHAIRLHKHVTSSEHEQLSALVQRHFELRGQGTGTGPGSVPVSWPMASVLSLLTQDLPTWKATCTKWLQEVTGADTSATRLPSGHSNRAGLGMTLSQALRFMCMVNWVQQHFKAESSGGSSSMAAAGGASSSTSASSSSRGAAWLSTMKARLETLVQVHSTATSFITYLEQLDRLADDTTALWTHLRQQLG